MCDKNDLNIRILDEHPWDPQYPKEVLNSFTRPGGRARAEVPSGLPYGPLYEGDHVLIVSATELPSSLYTALKRFAYVGLKDRVFTEVCSIEVDDRLEKSDILMDVSEGLPDAALERLDVLDWEESGDYFDQYASESGDRFQVSKMEEFFLAPVHRARREFSRKPNALLRVISQDSGRYLGCLINPSAYVRYERKLPARLSAAVGCPVVQLCAYEIADVIRASARSRTSRRLARLALILGLLRSHSVVYWIDDAEHWYYGLRAALRILVAAWKT